MYLTVSLQGRANVKQTTFTQGEEIVSGPERVANLRLRCSRLLLLSPSGGQNRDSGMWAEMAARVPPSTVVAHGLPGWSRKRSSMTRGGPTDGFLFIFTCYDGSHNPPLILNYLACQHQPDSLLSFSTIPMYILSLLLLFFPPPRSLSPPHPGDVCIKLLLCRLGTTRTGSGDAKE